MGAGLFGCVGPTQSIRGEMLALGINARTRKDLGGAHRMPLVYRTMN